MPPWISVSDALTIAGVAGDQLKAAGLKGDIAGRVVLEDGTTRPLPCHGWRAVDCEVSRVDGADVFPPLIWGNRDRPVARALAVEMDLETLRAVQGDTPKAPKNKAGRKSVIPPAALIEVTAWLAANGVPHRQARVADKLREAIAAAGWPEPANSTIRECAKWLVATYTRELDKAIAEAKDDEE